jgi:hypothetical protein
MRKLLFVVLVAAFSALVPGSASAAQPVVTHTTLDVGPLAITDVCSASITLSGHLVLSGRITSTPTARPPRLHPRRRDGHVHRPGAAWSASRTYGTFFGLDANGNIVSGQIAGVIVRIHLPDGSLFLSAGRVILHPNEPVFIFTPDLGRSANLSAFCGALGA